MEQLHTTFNIWQVGQKTSNYFRFSHKPNILHFVLIFSFKTKSKDLATSQINNNFLLKLLLPCLLYMVLANVYFNFQKLLYGYDIIES